MGERMNLDKELGAARYSTFANMFLKIKALSEEYGSLPESYLLSAFGAVNDYGSAFTTANPYTQNQRIKGVQTRPAGFDKNEVAQMLRNPEEHEKQLRQVERMMEYTAYPMLHTRTIYQNLLTYHNYIAPEFLEAEDAKKPAFMREWRLVEKLRETMNVAACAHELTGMALQEGKVFVTPRYSVDKQHNRVHYAFLQQLPSDWVKIVGYNNKSKYTVAFNLLYFMQPGTDWRQYGDLFAPYMTDFSAVVAAKPRVSIDLPSVKKRGIEAEVYSENEQWFYWVTLPVERVFPFEIDDTNRNAVSPFTGLFLDMLQLSQMEKIQLELLQNPLVAVLHGEIPYYDTKDTNTADQYMLSPAGRSLFEMLWYQMMTANNTGGIGFYAAPLKNMKLDTLAEAPGAIEIVAQGYKDTMAKAGLSAIIPTSDEARAGAVTVSLQLESRFAEQIYTCMERMFRCILDSLSLRHCFKFHMFGTLSSDAEEEKHLREEMTLGILPSTLRFAAMRGSNIFEDFATSAAIESMGLLDKRLPLVSTYSAKQETGALPPQTAKPAGRPKSEGVTSDGNEGDIDGAK